MSESCPADEMLENGKTWVSLAFPTCKEAVISQLQDPWVLLSQGAKKREFLILTKGSVRSLAFSVYCVRGQHRDQEGAICFRMCVYAAAGVYQASPGSPEERSYLQRQQRGKRRKGPFPSIASSKVEAKQRKSHQRNSE